MTRYLAAAATFILGVGIGLAITPAHSTVTVVTDAGTARPASVGGAWSLVGAPGHSPQGLGTPTCDAAGHLQVPYLTTFTAVVGSSVETDETWSRQGIIVGASVGLDHAELWFTKLTADGPVALSCAALANDGGNVWVQFTGIA